MDINKIIQIYENFGYIYKTVPTIVNKNILSITHSHHFYIPSYYFIASGEQGFLHLITKCKLVVGKYQTYTACCRPYEKDDFLHQELFFKLELININPKNPQIELFKMILEAYAVYSLECTNLSIVNTEYGFDIENNNIELGSYGIRYHNDICWVYGTGIAYPRIYRSKYNELSYTENS